MAHNHEDTGSKPVAGIYLHIASVHQGTRATLNRGGAVGARGAHNLEDIGSNPISGIVKLDVKRIKLYTGVAQWKRAVKHRHLPFLPLVVRFDDGYGL